ncbi:hypothetical protein AAVH_22384 [Aphelenchoides avenae]|nr:hypothetical protein AAVH_22384 [Aphelenchus avenae]
MSYSHSWPSIGTTDPQRIIVRWQSGVESVVHVERTHRHTTPDQLAAHLNASVTHGRSALVHVSRMTTPTTMRAALAKISGARVVSTTKQLLHAMGFKDGDSGAVQPNAYARYPPDLHGGFGAIRLRTRTYWAGHSERHNRVATTHRLRTRPSGRRPGGVYAAVQYRRLKEVTEIEIQIKSASNRLCPFKYGNVI